MENLLSINMHVVWVESSVCIYSHINSDHIYLQLGTLCKLNVRKQ